MLSNLILSLFYPPDPPKDTIDEKVTEIKYPSCISGMGLEGSTAKLIEFSFETTVAPAEFPDRKFAGFLNANKTYTHRHYLYTTDFTFLITLIFDDAGFEGKNAPRISDEINKKEVLIEHYNRATKAVIDQSKITSVEHKIYILGKPLEEYLKQYLHLDNVRTFLEQYESSNKVFKNEEVSLDPATQLTSLVHF